MEGIIHSQQEDWFLSFAWSLRLFLLYIHVGQQQPSQMLKTKRTAPKAGAFMEEL